MDTDLLAVINLDSHQPSKVVKSIASHFDISIETDCDEHITTLPESVGSMRIGGVDFYDGYGLLFWKGALKQDLQLCFKGNQHHPLQFLFCVVGNLCHSIDHDKIMYNLESYKGSITAVSEEAIQMLKLPAGTELLVTSLVINREDFIEKVDCSLETLPAPMCDIFRDTESSSNFFYVGNYSIASSECIKKIQSCEYTGLVRMTYLESKALELLSFQLKQYKDDQEPAGKQVLLRRYDVDKIINAKELLLNDLRNAPNIKELSRLAGLNENKLKKGFKLIFDATINQYLRNERLQMARLLLMENNRSIAEVAELVGYNSKGHFARRFKGHFGMLPKDYVKHLKSKISRLESDN